MNAHTDPAQLTAASALPPASTEEPLTLWLADFRELNEMDGGIAASVRYDHRDFVDRVMMNHLGNSAFKLMVAITTRTLQFDKVAETIPQEQFVSDLRKSNKDNSLSVNKYGTPIFEGTGMTRNSVKSGLKELLSKGVISSFTVIVPRTGPVTAYMPFSWRTLYIASAKYNGLEIRRLTRLVKDNPKIRDLVFRPPVHELEDRHAWQFPEGMAVAKKIEAMYRNDLSRFSAHAVNEAMRSDRLKLEHGDQ